MILGRASPALHYTVPCSSGKSHWNQYKTCWATKEDASPALHYTVPCSSGKAHFRVPGVCKYDSACKTWSMIMWKKKWATKTGVCSTT